MNGIPSSPVPAKLRKPFELKGTDTLTFKIINTEKCPICGKILSIGMETEYIYEETGPCCCFVSHAYLVSRLADDNVCAWFLTCPECEVVFTEFK